MRSLGKLNSRLRDVLKTMMEKDVQLLALSEVRWPGHGVSELDGNIVIHSGLAEGTPQNRRSGVAVTLRERAAATWRQAGSVFTPVLDRLLSVRFKCHTGFVSIIAVYAPTNEPGNVQDADKFYQALQECVDGVPKHDMLLVMGDFNARVGNDIAVYTPTNEPGNVEEADKFYQALQECVDGVPKRDMRDFNAQVGNDVSAWQGLVGRFGPGEQNENRVRLLLIQWHGGHQHVFPAQAMPPVDLVSPCRVRRAWVHSGLCTSQPQIQVKHSGDKSVQEGVPAV